MRDQLCPYADADDATPPTVEYPCIPDHAPRPTSIMTSTAAPEGTPFTSAIDVAFRKILLALAGCIVATVPVATHGYYNYKCTNAAGRVTYQDKPCGALARAAASKPSSELTPEEREALLEENRRAMFNRPPDSKVEEIFAKCPAIPDHIKSQAYVMLFYYMQTQAACEVSIPGFRERTASARKAARRHELVRLVENDPAYKEYVRKINQVARDAPPTGEAKAALDKQCEQIAEAARSSSAASSKSEPKPQRDARYYNPNRTISVVQAALRDGRVDDALEPMTSPARTKFEARMREMSRAELRALAGAIAPYRFRIWIGSACYLAQANRDDTGDDSSAMEFENHAGNWLISNLKGPDFDLALAKR